MSSPRRAGFIAATIVSLAIGCSSRENGGRQPSPELPASTGDNAAAPSPPESNDMSKLHTVLDAVAVFDNEDASDLFSETAMAELAQIADVDAALVAVIGDSSEPLARRFAAVEAALQRGIPASVQSAATTSAIVDVVAQAIPRDSYHNRWGLPGHSHGRLARRILALPELDLTPLVPLLDDQSLLEILGSEAATIQDRSQFRVADLAAALIATSRHQAFPTDRDPAVRDRFIATLR